eukprot:COSAG02_NODE_6170_length_3753_cov_8.278816_3_plen_90_part_00
MPRRPSRTPGHAQQSNNGAFHKEDGCRTALINGMQFAGADDAPPQLRPDAAEMLMIHQKMIDSEDFTTQQSVSPATSSAHKPDRYSTDA